MTVEELAKQIFAECEKDGEPVTEEESRAMAEMELKAKENFKNYVATEPTKKSKAKRTVKLDEDKVHLINLFKTFAEGLELNGTLSEVAVTNPQKEISFIYKGDSYSISLIKHRPPK